MLQILVLFYICATIGAKMGALDKCKRLVAALYSSKYKDILLLVVLPSRYDSGGSARVQLRPPRASDSCHRLEALVLSIWATDGGQGCSPELRGAE